MSPLDDQPAEPFARLADIEHSHPSAEGVSHQPVLKYVVTIKRILNQLADIGKIVDGNMRRSAVARQVNIETRIRTKRLPHRAPLMTIPGKTVQKDQPGIARQAAFSHRVQRHS